MCTVLSETVMAPTLGGCSDGMLLRNCSLPRAPGRRPARPGHDHRLAGGHATELLVIAGAVHRRRLADELSEAGGEGAEARTADRETDLRHAQVAATQQRLRPLDAPGHEVRVRRLGVGLAEAAAEVSRRH